MGNEAVDYRVVLTRNEAVDFPVVSMKDSCRFFLHRGNEAVDFPIVSMRKVAA
jgi:hypothetical protein